MALYEILLRGKADGTLAGAHIQEWVSDGTNPDGSPRFKVTDPRAITVAELTAYVGEQFAAVAAQASQSDTQCATLRTKRDTLRTERDQLQGQIEALATVMQERDALVADKIALTQERDAILAQNTGLKAEAITLKAEIITLKGTPLFKPSALAALFTATDLTAIQTAVTGSGDLWNLYNQLLLRAATGDALIPISSPTFLAGLAGLKTALGDARVTALFTALNIDLVAGRYIQP